MRYTVLLKQQNGHYYAVVPMLPSCAARGQTREEALHNVQVAIGETLAHLEMPTVEVSLPRPSASANCWLETAGMFQDDPLFDEMLTEVAAHRQAPEARNA